MVGSSRVALYAGYKAAPIPIIMENNNADKRVAVSKNIVVLDP